MLVWEIVGWVGIALYVLSYVLLALRVVPAGRLYYVLNITAAAFVAAVSVAKGSVQAAVINGLWAAASFYGYCDVSPPLLGLRPYIVRVAVTVLVGGGLLAVPFVDLPQAVSWMAWGSVVGYTGAYVLFVGGRMSILEFHIFNLIASTAILPSLIVAANWQVVVLEILWAMVAIAGIATDITAARRSGASRSRS